MEEEDEEKGFCAWTIKFETQEIAEAFAAEFKTAIKCNSSIVSPVKAAKPKVIAPSTPDQQEEEEEKKVEIEIAQSVSDEDKYKGWTDEEIAEDKARLAKAKLDAQAAKLFTSSSDNTNATNAFSWDATATATTNGSGFANFSFEDGQRGIDLEAEAVLNKVKVDGSISFGVSAGGCGDADPDFSNVTTRKSESVDSAGLGANNFSFDASANKPETVASWGAPSSKQEADEPAAETSGGGWGDIGGGFSSVKATDGFGNVAG